MKKAKYTLERVLWLLWDILKYVVYGGCVFILTFAAGMLFLYIGTSLGVPMIGLGLYIAGIVAVGIWYCSERIE